MTDKPTDSRNVLGHSKAKWRPYRADDKRQVLMLRMEQERLIGRALDTPNLGKHPVLIAEVLEGKDGKIKEAFFIEAYANIAIIGRSRRGMAEVEQRAKIVLETLKAHGFRIAQVEIPKGVPAKERKAMLKEANRIGKRSGFRFQREVASRGFFDLRETQNV